MARSRIRSHHCIHCYERGTVHSNLSSPNERGSNEANLKDELHRRQIIKDALHALPNFFLNVKLKRLVKEKGFSKDLWVFCVFIIFIFVLQLFQFSEGSARLAATLPTSLWGAQSQLAVTSDLVILPPHTTITTSTPTPLCNHYISVTMETHCARPSLRAVCDVMPVVTWLLSVSVDGCCCWILGAGGGGGKGWGGCLCCPVGEIILWLLFCPIFLREPELKIMLWLRPARVSGSHDPCVQNAIC